MSINKKLVFLNTTKSTLSQFFLAFSDLLWFNLGPFIAAGLVWLLWGDLSAYIPSDEIYPRLSAQLLLSVLCVGWFWARLRHYTYRKAFWFELKEVIRTVAIFSVIDLAIFAFSKWQVSRYIWVFTWTSIIIWLPLSRFITKRILEKLQLWSKGCVIIGSGPNAVEAYRALKAERELGLDFMYFFDPVNTLSTRRNLDGLRVINNERVLWRTVDPHNTQLFIALEDGQEHLREQWVQKTAKRQCRSVSVVPTTRGIPVNSTDMSYLFRHELLILRINTNLTKTSARILKRTFDVVVSSLILLMLSPILLVLALLVMKDKGSPIYGHTRIGKDGKPFKCLKFRSMVMNSQEVLQELLRTSPEARAEWDKDFKLRNDPRITKVGAFLRKSSLDELPQLFNVLKGEMSLVGPRPVIDEELERYGENKDYYLMAKPGMTGLWQVSGRNDVDYDTRVYFDAWYVKNWSLWNDIAIMFKTIGVVTKRSGAY